MKGEGWDRYFPFSFSPSQTPDEAPLFLPNIPSLPPSSRLSCHSHKPDVQVTLQGCNQKMLWGDEGARGADTGKTFYFKQAKCMLTPSLQISGAACSVCHESPQSGWGSQTSFLSLCNSTLKRVQWFTCGGLRELWGFAPLQCGAKSDLCPVTGAQWKANCLLHGTRVTIWYLSLQVFGNHF